MKSTQCLKTFLRLAGIFGLLLGLLTLPGAAARAQNGPTPGDITLADAAAYAQAQLEREQGVIAEWDGAQLLSPVIHYDLTGQRAAFVFPLARDGQDVGYITISAVAMDNPVLEFGRGPAYARASQKAVESAAASLSAPLDLDHPLYLGALAYFYRVDAPGDAQLVEMGTGQVVTLKGTPATPPVEKAPADLEPQTLLRQANPQVLPAVVSSRLLAGPDYDWYHGCGPTAAGNLMGYYADRGFPNLVAGGSKGSYLAAIDELAVLMQTQLPEGWTWLPVNDDIMHYTANHGYGFSSTETYDPPFTALVSEIDLHRPVLVLVNGHVTYGNHFITAFGYQYDPANASQNYMIVHDTWSSTDVDAWVQFGAGYERIWFDTALPPAGSFTPDLTPPSSAMRTLDAYQLSSYFPISWSGTDTGFGIASYDVQVKDGVGGTWQDVLQNTTATSTTYWGESGHTYYFRSRARDIDQNLESWPTGNGDTSTTVALYIGGGWVETNREQPVMGATASSSPAQGTGRSDHTGRFLLPFGVGGTYDINIAGPNTSYGVSQPMKGIDASTWNDMPTFYLPPADNAIQNGQFEGTSLTPWTTGGDVLPVLQSTAHTGVGAAKLGSTSMITGSSWIRQTLNVSANLTRPTLSFIYLWNTTNPLDGQFVVTISDGTNTQTVDLGSAGNQWVHRWVDMSPYQGKTVTIQFQMNQILGNPNQTALLDEVTLGSELRGLWSTYLPSVRR